MMKSREKHIKSELKRTGISTGVSSRWKLSDTMQKIFTAEEVAEHQKRDDIWIIVDGKVYDVTNYIEDVNEVLSIHLSSS